MKKLFIFLLFSSPALAQITFSPAGGTYAGAQTVTVNCPATLTCFYTLDGSKPSIAGFKYTTPFNVTGNTTIRVIAAKVGVMSRNVEQQQTGWKCVTNVAHNYAPTGPSCEAGGGIGSLVPSDVKWSFGSPGTQTMSATNTTGSTQMLFVHGDSSTACTNCTELVQDKVFQVSKGRAFLENNELDSNVNMLATYNQFHTASLQCNQQAASGRWQYDNQQGSWIDFPGTEGPSHNQITYGCDVSTTQQTEIRYGIHWANGDTSCTDPNTGPGWSKDHYDFLTICVGGTQGTGGVCRDYVFPSLILCGYSKPSFAQKMILQDQPDGTNTVKAGVNPYTSTRSLWNDNATLAFFGTEVTATANYIIGPVIPTVPASLGGTHMFGGAFFKMAGGQRGPNFIYNGGPGPGNTYYVSPDGSDSNPGTLSLPWLTPARAATGRIANDTVIFLDGTYTLPASSSFRGDWYINLSGTSGNPITFKSQHLYGAHIVSTSSGDGTTAIGMFGSFLTIMGFDITGSTANGITMAVDGTTDNNVRVTRNYIHDITTPCDADGGSAITTGSGNNYEVGNKTFFIDANLIFNIKDPVGCAPGVLHGAGISAMLPFTNITNNIVLSGGRWPIQSWHAAHNDLYYGNTVINGQTGLTIGAGDSGMVAGGNTATVVQNNIIINQSVVAIQETGTVGTNTYTDNLSFQGVTTFSFQGTNTDTGTLHVDPLFVNNTGTSGGNYNLRTASPTIGHGLSNGAVLTDYSGVPRPSSGSQPMGAEFTICGYGSSGVC